MRGTRGGGIQGRRRQPGPPGDQGAVGSQQGRRRFGASRVTPLSREPERVGRRATAMGRAEGEVGGRAATPRPLEWWPRRRPRWPDPAEPASARGDGTATRRSPERAERAAGSSGSPGALPRVMERARRSMWREGAGRAAAPMTRRAATSWVGPCGWEAPSSPATGSATRDPPPDHPHRRAARQAAGPTTGTEPAGRSALESPSWVPPVRRHWTAPPAAGRQAPGNPTAPLPRRCP
jgi:hypothetical protein